MTEIDPHQHDKLVDRAVRILWDWCHEPKPRRLNGEHAMAMGLLQGEVMRLRGLLDAHKGEGYETAS
ncbi:hypothetical protein LCGC14_2436330 [marine sediment metagenome]|uniref:Uncharacterized protein n=1 Tax=marine sediment metagenome TaxID=412755 RepID=A0A0F9BKH7_9ZZZZ